MHLRFQTLSYLTTPFIMARKRLYHSAKKKAAANCQKSKRYYEK